MERTKAEKKQILKDYREFGRAYLEEKYNIKSYSTIFNTRCQLEPWTVKPQKVRDEKKNIQILRDYHKHGTRYVSDKYNISYRSVSGVIGNIKTKLA